MIPVLLAVFVVAYLALLVYGIKVAQTLIQYITLALLTLLLVLSIVAVSA